MWYVHYYQENIEHIAHFVKGSDAWRCFVAYCYEQPYYKPRYKGWLEWRCE